jgi:hypothetical protein
MVAPSPHPVASAWIRHVATDEAMLGKRLQWLLMQRVHKSQQ